jgi:hypothetical protein
MKIVIDTTVFGHGFNPRSSDVQLLKSYLDRSSAELCVPALVVEEAVNLVRKSIDEVNQKLEGTLRLTGDEKIYRKHALSSNVTTYRESVQTLLKSLNGRILPYPNVPHSVLVSRALAPNKPFVPSGRGYRDALIWFSVLELARSCGQEIVFITANSEDFCQSKKDLTLHGDLLNDLKSCGIKGSRVRLLVSLAEFIQEFAVATLPVSPPPSDIMAEAPDYRQLLIDGEELIKTLLASELPEFLRKLSRADAPVEDLEVVGISSPAEISSSPSRTVDADRRLLRFSAKYTVAVQCLIKKTDLAIWSQRLSLHLRQDWDDSRLRIQATRSLKVTFNMIERGEETEAFSVVQVAPAYKIAYEGIDPVAVKLNQSEIHAPEHTTWGTVKCDSCGEGFGVGCHRLYPTGTAQECVTKLEKILAEDHKAGRAHENLYKLGCDIT